MEAKIKGIGDTIGGVIDKLPPGLIPLPMLALISVARQFLGGAKAEFRLDTGELIKMGVDQANPVIREKIFAMATDDLDARVAELEAHDEGQAPEGFLIGKPVRTKSNKTLHPCTELEFVHRVMFDLLRDEFFTFKGGGRAADGYRDAHLANVAARVAERLDANTPLREAITMIARELVDSIWSNKDTAKPATPTA